MTEDSMVQGKTSAVGSGFAWAAGAAAGSFVLGNACIFVGAMVALIAEVGVATAIGQAINVVAFVFMIVSYSLALIVIMRYLSSRYSVPWTAWAGLAAYPLVWGALVLTTRADVYGIAPIAVNGLGLVAAWLAVGRRGSRRQPGATPDRIAPRARSAADGAPAGHRAGGNAGGI